MGKIKGKKKSKINKKKITDPSVKAILNPFEIHYNIQKYNILGRKLNNDKGLPGVSRSKALMRRKETLFHEYQQRDKSNQFIDKRIGERNASMTNEDRVLARFAAEQKKAYKSAKFNLADDDDHLTHKGRALTDIEMHEDPRSDDDEEDDDGNPINTKGNLSSEFVKGAHFGGGVLTVNENNKNGDISLSRKELIDKLILESKKRKAEKMQSKEKTLALTEKLDSEWKDLFTQMSSKIPKVDKKTDIDKPDDYDVAVRQLKFESRGQPTDKLKSQEVIAKEEFDKLKKLEEDRLMRMTGITLEDRKLKHRSADDLDDGFDLMDTITDEIEVLYDKDGNLIAKEDHSSDKDGSENEEDELGSDENEDELGSDEDEEDELGSDEDEEDELGSDENGEEEEDDFSDLKESEDNETHSETECKSDESKKVNKEEDIKMKEIAEKELPYTFEFPESYEDFEDLLKDKSIIIQSIIIQRLIKCFHISLDKDNRERLNILFTFLLQYIQDISLQDSKNCFRAFEKLLPIFYDLVQISPSHSKYCLIQVLKEKYEQFIRKKQKTIPKLNTLIFLKLIPYLFPTSDFEHPVSTPALIFIEQILSLSKVRSLSDIVRSLFVITIYMEYTSLSRRISPSAINFLREILYMSYPEFESNSIYYSFKTKEKLLLIESGSEITESSDLRLTISELDVENTKNNESLLKSKCLYTTLKMIQEFLNNYSENLKSPYHFFEPFLEILNKLEKYINSLEYNFLKQIKTEIVISLEGLNKILEKPLVKLLPEFKKPKLLKQFEPRVKKVYIDQRHRSSNPEKAHRDKLVHKIRREKKGALREIRRDKSFLAKVKLKETLRSDAERVAKVKEIYGSAATQQGELRALKRKK